MGKYIELTSADAVLYLPRTLFRQADFHRVSKPFIDIHAELTGLRAVTGDELQRLRGLVKPKVRARTP
jgi:hypothetical protein